MKNVVKSIAIMFIGFVLLFIGIYLIVRLSENNDQKRFNNGICINCGEKLEPFDVDKYGNIVWLCDNCGYNCVH